MENKYKVGDKMYFSYFSSDDIIVEEYEITKVYKTKVKLRDPATDALSDLHLSWLGVLNTYFDTYEEAYNYAVEHAKLTLIEALADVEKEARILREKIAKFNDKYGKKD